MTAPAIIRMNNFESAQAQIQFDPSTGIDEIALANTINAIFQHNQVRAVYTHTYNIGNRLHAYIIDIDSDNTIGTLVFQ